MFGASFRITTIMGIPIKVHISLIFMVLVMISFYGLFTGIILELGLICSIVLHELGHSIVAIQKGCRVREITLMFIGGAAQMERIPEKPIDEFFMAVAGPIVSLILGITGIVLSMLLSFIPYISTVLYTLGGINLALTIFNLIPAFPMDGGRVLRAALAAHTGRVKATFIAARIGKILAVLFGIYGLGHNPFLIFIAFFIYFAAGQEYKMVQLEEMYKHRMPGFDDGFYTTNFPEEQVFVSPPPYEKKKREKSIDIFTED